MKRKTIDKGISAAGAVLFVGAIQAAGAPLWAVASLALAVYEIGQWVCRIARRQAKKELKRKYIIVSRLNAQRWADTQFGWQMREVN